MAEDGELSVTQWLRVGTDCAVATERIDEVR